MPIDTEAKQVVKLVDPPPNLKSYEEVFVVRFTGEIFRDYERYAERITYYQRRIFQCAVTKKSGLTLEEALLSESQNKSSSSPAKKSKSSAASNAGAEEDAAATELPKIYIREICKQVHLSTQNFNALSQSIYQYLQSNYFVGEEMRVTLPKNVKMNVRILDIPLPNKYRIVYLDDNGNIIVPQMLKDDIFVSSSLFPKRKPQISLPVVKDIVKQVAVKPSNSDPWIVKESYASECGIKVAKDLAKLAKEAEARGDNDSENERKSPSKKRKAEEISSSEKKGKKEGKKKGSKGDSEESSEEDSDEDESESSSSSEAEGPAKKKRKKDEDFDKKKGLSASSPRKSKKKPLDELDFDRSKMPEKDGRPIESRVDFAVPQNCIAPMVQVWSFLNGLSNYLQLTPFSIDDFVGALQYQRDSTLLAEIHLALLRTIFGTPLGGGMMKNQVSLQQWRRALLEFLQKPKVAAAFKFETIVSILKYGSYFSLNLEEKLAILEFLFLNCMQLETIHRRLDELWEQAEQVKKEKRAKLTAVRKEMKNEPAEAIEAALARHEGQFAARLERLRIRIEPLGMDRYLNRYYWFGPQDFADKDLSWKVRITPECATRLYVQYYLPNVNLENPKLRPYSGAARDFAIVPELEIEQIEEEPEIAVELLVTGRGRREKKAVNYAEMDKFPDPEDDRRNFRGRAADSVDSESDHDSKCSVCAKPGNLLLCDGCPSAWHMHCLKPPMTELPEGEWFCPSCTADKEDDYPHQCAVCGFGGNLICCDGCPTVWHFKCITPPLVRAPVGDWFCPHCVARTKAEFGDNVAPERYPLRPTRGMKKTPRYDEEERPQHLSRNGQNSGGVGQPRLARPPPPPLYIFVTEEEFFRFPTPTPEFAAFTAGVESKKVKIKFSFKPAPLLLKIPINALIGTELEPMFPKLASRPRPDFSHSLNEAEKSLAPLNTSNRSIMSLQSLLSDSEPSAPLAFSLPQFPPLQNLMQPLEAAPEPSDSMKMDIDPSPSFASVPVQSPLPSSAPSTPINPFAPAIRFTELRPTSVAELKPTLVSEPQPIFVAEPKSILVSEPKAAPMSELEPVQVSEPILHDAMDIDEPEPNPAPSPKLSPRPNPKVSPNASPKAEVKEEAQLEETKPKEEEEDLDKMDEVKEVDNSNSNNIENNNNKEEEEVDKMEVDQEEGNEAEVEGEEGKDSDRRSKGRPKGTRNYAHLMPKDAEGNPIFPDDDEWREKQRKKEEKERKKEEEKRKREEKEREKAEKAALKAKEREEKGEEFGSEEEDSEEEEKAEDDEHKAKKNQELKEYQALLEKRYQDEQDEVKYCHDFLGDPETLYMGDYLYNQLWGFYDSEESLTKLVAWLDERGPREESLKKKLEKRLPRILDCIKSRQRDLQALDNDIVTRKSARVQAKNEEKQKEVFLYYKNKLRK